MRSHRFLLLLACVCQAPAVLSAQEKKPAVKAEAPAHDELRSLRKSLTDAIEKKDVDRQLEHVHKNVVVTWQNGEVVRGQDGLRDFYQKNVAQQKVFQGYKELPSPAELTILHSGDDTGISYGTSVGRYQLLGAEFELKNHWTATLIKEAGKWKIASYHVSANVLDNPLLGAAKNYLYTVGIIALVIGLLVGFLGGRFSGRSRQPA
jgi:ketosteroid isomerase-like protein